VVTTDSGHEGAVFDASFMRDQQAALDFAYLAVGRVALAARDVVARYYGRPAAKAYFTGCSTGGREGMLMAERYPAYFDGIVAGAPAMRTGRSNLGLAWANHAFAQVSPKDEDGKPDPCIFEHHARRDANVAHRGSRSGIILLRSSNEISAQNSCRLRASQITNAKSPMISLGQSSPQTW